MSIVPPGFSPRLFLCGLALAIFAPALSVLAEEGETPPGLDDHPAIQGSPVQGPSVQGQRQFDYHDLGTMFGRPPSGTAQFPPTVVGPGGVVTMPAPSQAKRTPTQPPPAVTPQERAARIRKALTPKPPLAVVRRRTLDDLYRKLATAKDGDEASGLATLIGQIWLRSGSDTADLLMQRALQSIDKKDYKVALDVLDRLVALRPGWAEAWNKRASVRFAQRNLDGAMADVEHVLRLEPKHFGALDGMGAILQQSGFDKRALDVYRRSLAIYPHQPQIEKIVEKLQLDVEGQGI